MVCQYQKSEMSLIAITPSDSQDASQPHRLTSLDSISQQTLLLNLPVCISVYLSACISVCLSACISDYLHICLSVCIFIGNNEVRT